MRFMGWVGGEVSWWRHHLEILISNPIAFQDKRKGYSFFLLNETGHD